MTVSRFRVIGELDGAGGPQGGTVLIDRATNIFYVRPYGRHKMYSLGLGDVATMVCRAIIMAELREKRPTKKTTLVKRRTMKEQTIAQLKMQAECIVRNKIPPNKLKRKYEHGINWISHKSPSSNSGGVGRAGRRLKRVGKRK